MTETMFQTNFILNAYLFTIHTFKIIDQKCFYLNSIQIIYKISKLHLRKCNFLFYFRVHE